MNKNKNKMHNIPMKRIFVYSILIFLFSIVVGYYYSVLWKSNKESISKVDDPNMEENVVETLSNEEKVSYNSSFSIKKYYEGCGHIKIQNAELPLELVNLTKKEVEEIYSGWNLEVFSKDNIVLSQKIDSICDDHYVLKLGEENIEIYHIENGGKMKLYKDTNISKEYLADEDLKNLKKGIYVYGVSNLNSAIEDFE